MTGGGVAERDPAVVGTGPSVLADVFRSHHRSLVRTAWLLLGNRADAEEAVQEAYFRVERAVQRSGSVDAGLPYVRAAVINVCRSGLRRRMLARLRPARPAPDAESAEEVAERRSEGAAVVAAIRGLPRRQRECVVLRYYGGLSEAETAATLGIAAGTVKSHVHRALSVLAHVLEDE